MDLSATEIDKLGNSDSADCLRRLGSVAGEDPLDSGCAGCALVVEVDEFLAKEAVAEEDLFEKAGNVFALGGQGGGQFADEKGSGVGVFVPDSVGGEVAVAFFAAKDIPGAVFQEQIPPAGGGAGVVIQGDTGIQEQRLLHFLFIKPQLFTDPFEAGEGVDALQAIDPGNLFLQGGGDKGLDQGAVLGVFRSDHSGLHQRADPAFGEQRTDAVSGEEDHFSRSIADRYTHAVGIRVGSDHHRGPGSCGCCNAQAQCFGVLRIG